MITHDMYDNCVCVCISTAPPISWRKSTAMLSQSLEAISIIIRMIMLINIVIVIITSSIIISCIISSEY